MQKGSIKKLSMQTKDNLSENVNNISDLFPNALVETEEGKKIDFDILKQELSKDIIEGNRERYHLDFPGKKEAIVEANRKINKTLRPIKEKSVDFDNTKNIYIEGDNLEALKILQESYLGKIKCIYIDPPYNTGNDFVYNDKFSKSTKEEMIADGRMDEDGNILISKDINNDSNGRYHSDWLKMMYPRLKLARNLLSDDGVIFISIDDNEQDNLKKMCNEIFGENNFISQLIWQNKEGGGKSDSKFFRQKHEYIYVYAKSIQFASIKPLPVEDEDRYKLEDEYVNTRGKYQLIKLDSGSLGWVKSLDYPIELDGHVFYAGGSKEKWEERQNGGNAIKDWGWRWSKDKLKWGIENGFVVTKEVKGEWNIYTKQYFNCDKDGNIIDGRKIQPTAVIDDYSTTQANKNLKDIFGSAIFNYSKPKELIKYLLNLVVNKGEIVLDFFSGSATTAEAMFEFNYNNSCNNSLILCQLPEVLNNSDYKTICDIGEERIRRAGKKIKEENPLITKDLDIGFRVYKVDDSNMKDIYYTPDKIDQQNILDMVSNVKEDRTAEDLLTQVMLNLGLPLDLHIEEKKIGKNKVFFVEKNSLVACFDDKVDINILDEISKASPLKMCLRESSFTKDQDKINFFERLKKLSPDTEATII